MKYSKVLERLPRQFFADLEDKERKSREAGNDVIVLGQGNPDQPTPKHIIEALHQASNDPETHKYSPFTGIKKLKVAISEFYKREYDVDIDPDKEVAILFGGKAGLVELPICFCDEGDTVLLPDPGYPDYLSGISLAQAKSHMMPLVAENKFLPDYQAIPKDVLEESKLLFINYPNNPTGAMATKEFFEETVELAKENNIIVCHDFAYGAFGFDGNKPLSYLQTKSAKETGIEIYTFSKTYNMAGWRIGFAVGNEEVVKAIDLLQDHLYVSLFPAVQEAATVALNSSQDCVEELLALYEARKNTLIDGCKEIGWKVDAPEGSFFAWLKVPSGYTSKEFTELLFDKLHISVAPGSGFGEYGEGYVRVGLVTEEERIKEAINRLRTLDIFE